MNTVRIYRLTQSYILEELPDILREEGLQWPKPRKPSGRA